MYDVFRHKLNTDGPDQHIGLGFILRSDNSTNLFAGYRSTIDRSSLYKMAAVIRLMLAKQKGTQKKFIWRSIGADNLVLLIDNKHSQPPWESSNVIYDILEELNRELKVIHVYGEGNHITFLFNFARSRLVCRLGI